MKRHLIATVLAAVVSLAFCSSALGAVTLSFSEAQHEPAVIYKGDEVVGYTVKLQNAGTTATSGTTNVAVALPAGVKLAVGSGSGWTCHVSGNLCTSNEVVAGGAEFSPLSLEAWIFPGESPQGTITATFNAFGGGATGPDAIAQESFTLAPEKPFELETFTAKTESEGGGDYTQAGGHPFGATTVFSVPTRNVTSLTIPSGQGRVMPVQDLRNAYFELPAGFIGNPEAADICTVAQLSPIAPSPCPPSAAVGGIKVLFAESEKLAAVVPIYRVFPEEGYAAAFAFRPVDVSALTVVLRAKLRSNGDYGVTAASPLPPQTPALVGVEFATLCGFGANVALNKEFASCRTPAEMGPEEVPFLTNPTRCAGAPPVTVARIDSYQNPGAQNAEGFPDLSDPDWKSKEAPAPATTGCEALTEAWVGARKPSLTFQPESTQAAAPTGYSAQLHIPQDGLLEKEGLATAHLDNTTVTLPTGIALNPSAASGLGACSEAQAGYLGNDFPAPNPIRFSSVAPGCPDNSKIGNVTVSTPILGHDLPGSVYLAAQDANPFGSKFAIYLVVEDEESGIHATLAGKVTLDQVSGQISTSFTNNPQAPLEDVKLDFFGGPRASLTNPDVCADYSTTTALTPWSAVDPDNPTAAETAFSTDTVTIDGAPEGRSSCATSKASRPFEPSFDAGSTTPKAGSTSPFSLRITRGAGQQELSEVTVNTPPGFAAILKGVAVCSDDSLAAAAARTGAAELASPSCPSGSQIGTTTIGAGAGPNPFYVKTGKVYLTGPYRGAPVSLAFIVPAVAGPFDLGVQVVRTALYVDPKNAQVTAKSDPIPQILDGVPLNIRDVRVDLNPGFALNPTNCEAMAVSGQVSGASGAVANVSNRFQVGDCDKLGFEPRLKLRLQGATKRDKYQKLTATLTARPGDANIARASVRFPQSIFLAQEHIRTICTRVQFAAESCPPGSVYGYAEAVTPLLDEPVVGPVYLRSSDNVLPDLVAALRGPDRQPIKIELAGRTDSKNKGIRNTFDVVPDAPVSSFTLRMRGGKKSLLVTSRDICKRKERAVVEMQAQNGLQRDLRPVIQTDCGKKKQKSAKKGKPGKKRAERQTWYLRA